jgi:serine phosphatase RsbU (regulator of sigma subunit)/pSer/pThr/pTyr-binding forkhead associated (FHA) protein
MPRIVLNAGRRAGHSIAFAGAVTIGRASDADVRLDDTTVSRRHAQIRPGGSGWTLQDLGTQNGTFVNGERLSQAVLLREGDLVQFGGVATTFHEAREAPPAVAFEDKKGGGESVVVTMEAGGAGLPLSAAEAARAKTLAQRLEFLSDLAGDLGGTFDEAAMLARILDRLFVLLPQADRGFVLLCDARGELLPRAVRGRAPEAKLTVSRSLARSAIEKRQGILTIDLMGDERFAKAQSLVGVTIHAVMCVPILTSEQVFGVLQVDSMRAGQPFDEGDMALLMGIARQLALSLANARLHAQLVEQELLQHDLALAGRIQQRLLPRALPEIAGCSFAAECTPAQQVGGDFYQFLELPDGRIGVAIGDVSGKGVSAALCMARTMSDIRYQSAGESEPGRILERANRALYENLEEGMFVTVSLVSFDPKTGETRYARAGHPPPLVRDAGGNVTELGDVGGAALGVGEDSRYEQGRCVLDRGDVVVLYSDGVTEAMNRSNALYGDDRFRAVLRGSGGGATAVKEAVLADLEAFVSGREPNDDLTLVCFGPDA